MTTIPVIGGIYYLTEVGVQWRNQDWLARNLIKAMKGEDFNGYSDIKFGATVRRLTSSNREEIVPLLLGAFCASYCKKFPEAGTLVPVPNSEATVGSKEAFRSQYLAEVFAGHSNGKLKVVPALRWKQPKRKAHVEGGPRDPQVYYENLEVLAKVEGPVFIFDDVRTTGSQIMACYRRLTEAGADVTKAIVIGKAVKEQKERVLTLSIDEMDVDFSPFDFEF